MKKGWETKKMGEVLAILRNGVNCKQDKKGLGDKISRIESISNADFDIDKVGYTALSKSDKEKYRLNKGDILFSHINSPIHVGKTALFNSDEEVYHGVNLLLMRPKPFLDVNYFELYLKFLSQNGYWMRLCKQSVNQASVNQQDINKVEISFPQTLQEQRNIVLILDETFASIAKAKSNAEQNLKNAKELFESYKNELFLNKGKGYDTKELREVCDKITQGPNPKYDKYGNDKFRVLKTKNLYDNNIFYDESDRVSESVFKSCLPSELKNGDVLLAIVGQGSINKCNVFENKTLFRFIYTRALGLIRVKKSVLNPYYLKAYLQSRSGKNLIDSGIGGTSGQQVVTTTFIKSLKIPFPSLKDQMIIVQKLDALSSETKKLGTIYQQKLNDLEELKKSILQKAFSGELKTT
jgi:type I restriction enzyme S subunit